jgi:glucose uptake protein
MLLPQTYGAALSLTILTMLCWGSWANTLKLCPGFRFQLFYWDYAIGMSVGAIFWGITAGSVGHAGLPFLADLAHTAAAPMFYAMIGGAIFNVANLLLVAAIDVAGLAVAFPVGIGLALVIGAISNYVIKPVGNPLLLFGGVALSWWRLCWTRRRIADAKAPPRQQNPPLRLTRPRPRAGILCAALSSVSRAAC